MSEKTSIYNNLFEIWTSRGKTSQFVGNGGVVIDPDGQRRMVTAAHVMRVAMNNGELEVRTQGMRIDIPQKPDFQQVGNLGIDVVEMELPPGEGLLVAKAADLEDPLRVIGSIEGVIFDIKVQTKLVNGRNVSSFPDPKKVDLEKKILIHYAGVTDQDKILPGTSGSLVFDRNDHVIAVNVAGLREKEGFSFVLDNSRKK